MANENNPNSSLSEGIALIENCLDKMLSEQRKAAHSAIDMDDWSKTEEIIAATKKHIVRIESLKNKFAEFKAEAVKLEFISADEAAEHKSEAARPAEQPKKESKPAEQPKSEAKPEEQSKPEPKPAEQPKPEPKPAEQPKPEPKPAEQPKPEAKPAEQPKPEPKPTEQPKPAPKPAEQPKPTPKPAEQPKPAPKPAEQPKPQPQSQVPPNPAPQPKPAEQPKPAPAAPKPNPLEMEMTDFDTEEDTRAAKQIIDACENLITKFPFSMRLIYSNSKIGKFFTSDKVIADNDMSKPKQLSNGLWVETNIPDEKVQPFIRGIARYCEESVNM